MAAAGAVTLAGSDDSTAILHAERLRPGQSASGRVTLGNVGETPGRLSLLRTGMLDVPGRGGGRLSDVLSLQVDELGGAAPRLIWAGGLRGPDVIDLGLLPAGSTQTYRLTVTLPDTGLPPGPLGGDNALQGASVTVDWTWATESSVPPTPTPTPTPSATPTVTPAPTPVGLPTVIGGGAPRFDLRIPHQRVIKTRGISVFGTCDEPCQVTFRARIKTAPPRAKASARTLLRRGVFRSKGADRRLPGGTERRMMLKLSRRGYRTLKRAIHRRGRAAVVVIARVRGAGGARTVKRRIVLKRAAFKRR
jgi:hypothetical protein